MRIYADQSEPRIEGCKKRKGTKKEKVKGGVRQAFSLPGYEKEFK